ncbi:MAG: hypothetical protein JEZ08_13235 [Clostridiales bacterium]|nr:hypothetical protein [Clostridiales bacterium]
MNNTQIQFDFNLPEDDMEFLRNLEYRFHTRNDGRYRWMILENYPIPDGYNVSTASIAISIPNGYPTNQLDMAYFFPPLSRVDNKPIGATQVQQNILGQSYQRWSRHRTPSNPWRPGLDDISSHLSLINEWLLREFSKR